MHTLHPFFFFGVCNLSLVGFVTSSRRIHTHDVISTQTFPSSAQSWFHRDLTIAILYVKYELSTNICHRFKIFLVVARLFRSKLYGTKKRDFLLLFERLELWRKVNWNRVRETFQLFLIMLIIVIFINGRSSSVHKWNSVMHAELLPDIYSVAINM